MLRRLNNMQTPLALAREHCANFNPDGSCLGAQLDDAGQITLAKPLAACLLNKPVRSCSYFEQCVAPLATTLQTQLDGPRSDWPKDDRARAAFPKLVSDFHGALHIYRQQSGSLFTAKRKCPDCQTRPLETGKQRCPVCQDAREKESRRQRNARYHQSKTES